MRMLAGVLAGRPFLDGAHRRRVAARAADGAGRRTAARDGCAPRRPRRRRARAARHPRRCAARAATRARRSRRAQVKSALMLAGLQADGHDRGRVARAEPRPHRAHARRAAARRSTVDGLTVRVEAGPLEPSDFDVPGDPSSAAFFVVAACITPGSEIVHRRRRAQPDATRVRRRAAPHGRRHRRAGHDGARRRAGRRTSSSRSARSRPPTIEGDEIPNVQDEVPALAVAAAFADGVTEIRDAAELSVKESNRIGTLHQELTQLGLAVEPRARRSRRSAAACPRAGPAEEPRRPPDRDGRRGRGERHRRRVDRAGLARRRHRRIPSSPTTSRR